MRLWFGNDEIVAKWVNAHLAKSDPKHFPGEGFGPCQAIGIVSTEGTPIAGCVYHDWQPKFKTIQMSCAAITPRWATRRIVEGLLKYPFVDLGVRKVWTVTPHTNERALRFIKGLGFMQEAVLAYQFGDCHSVVCRMLERDFLRHYGAMNGQVQQGRRRAQAA